MTLNKNTKTNLRQLAIIYLAICAVGGYVQGHYNRLPLLNPQPYVYAGSDETNIGLDGSLSLIPDSVSSSEIREEVGQTQISYQETSPDQVKEEVEVISVVTPTQPPSEPSGTTSERQTATITAYSCGGLDTNAEIMMNCPSLLSGGPKTASGTIPTPYYTIACDQNNMGREFEIEGIGRVKCEDTGGAIEGSGRFDLYLPTVEEARAWGVKHLEYKLVK